MSWLKNIFKKIGRNVIIYGETKTGHTFPSYEKYIEYKIKQQQISSSIRKVGVIMYIKNGKRIVEVAIKHIVELPEHILDEDVDKYLSEMFPDKEFQWCDGDQDVFGDFQL